MLKVALINEMHQIKKGGVYHSVEALKSSLSELGADVDVFSIKKRGKIFNFIVSFPYFKEVFLWPFWDRYIYNKVNAQKYDVALYRNTTSLLLVKPKHTKNVLYTRGILDRQIRILLKIKIPIFIKLLLIAIWPFAHIFERRSFNKADRIVASKILFKEYLNTYFNVSEDKMVVIPQMVDLKSKKLDRGKKFDLLYVGRLSAPKNWGIMLELAKLKKYKIAVAVPEDIKIKNENNITYFCNLPYSQMEDLYKSSKIFVMPSFIESGPRVTIEAMSYGVPVVASPDGSGGFIKNGANGFIVKDNKLQDYTAKIDSILNDEHLRKKMSKRNKKDSELYSTKVLAPIYYNALNF